MDDMKTPRAEPRQLPARLRIVLAWSVVVGAGGSLIGLAYLGILHALEHALGPHAHGPHVHLLIMVGIGVLVSLLVRCLGSPGDIELLVDNVHVLENGRAETRHLRSLLPISLLCISSGGGMGPEAPLVQTSGTSAQWLAEKRNMSQVERRMLTIAGMAAAFTVLFGAPIGAALFALEILHRRGLQYHEALLPAVVASLIGYCVFVAASGLGLTPVWSFSSSAEPVPIDLVWAIGAGIFGGAVAITFTKSVELARRAIRPIPEIWRPPLGGLVLGSLALISPYSLTYGKYQINPLLSMTAAPASYFVIGALAKFLGTTATVASGWRGGFIIPLFFMGAALGHAIHLLVPSTNEAVIGCALMAAANTGVTKTPLGSTLVVSKMVGLALVPTTAIGAVIALLMTHRTGLLTSQRERLMGER
ncbi:MAG: chloride channel protein [Planctomycetota bacterium]